MTTPLIFDIKRCSTVDGPGIRTAIFFKGCNLDCFWCHNPESKKAKPQLALFSEKCISCGVCREVCVSNGQCKQCGACAESCPAGARKLYGKQIALDELMRVIEADKPYFDATGGGVTFSGGECMLYPEYLTNLAKLCHERNISVAIDTAGCVPYSSFEALLPYVDLFLYDVKCIDPELHKKGTGADNTLILQNLERLIKENKSIIVRVPVIPNFNDGDELERIKDFCEQRALTYELLPYHAYGDSKREALLN